MKLTGQFVRHNIQFLPEHVEHLKDRAKDRSAITGERVSVSAVLRDLVDEDMGSKVEIETPENQEQTVVEVQVTPEEPVKEIEFFNKDFLW